MLTSGTQFATKSTTRLFTLCTQSPLSLSAIAIREYYTFRNDAIPDNDLDRSARPIFLRHLVGFLWEDPRLEIC